MEKQGVVKPGLTPDTEGRLRPGEKRADSSQTQARQLDNDARKRAADEVAKTLKK